MESPITITNPMPAQLVVLSPEVIVLRDQLLAQAQGMQVTSEAEQLAADQLAKKISALFKDVEESRLVISRQAKSLMDQVNGAAGEAMLPLKLGWDDLVKRIRAFIAAENARREEEARLIREEQERKQREADEAAAAAAEQSRQAAIADLPPGVEPDAVAAPVTEHLPERVKPSAPIPKPLASKAYSERREPELVIDDEKLIPFEVNGMRLWKEISKSTIKTLLKAGIAVPGCHLEDASTVAMRR
jgi:hypothetical protein